MTNAMTVILILDFAKDLTILVCLLECDET